MGSRMALIGCLIVVVALLNGAIAQEYYQVGDSLGWTVPPNTSYYTNWASTQTFHVGGILNFTVYNGTHTYARVLSKAEYDNCAKVQWSANGTGPFSIMVSLPSTGTFYFICTLSNHCEQGQKLSVTVSSASSLTVGALFAVLTTTLISFMTYF